MTGYCSTVVIICTVCCNVQQTVLPCFSAVKEEMSVDMIDNVGYSVYCMYRTMVTICTTSVTFKNSTFCPHNVFMCFVWIAEQTAIISLYNIN